RFSDRVADYVRYRPSYPAAVLELLEARGALSPASVVADVGAGTGIFAALLQPRAGRVDLVEPNRKMLAAARQQLGGAENVRFVLAPAEHTGLEPGSVDLVTVAQAFHWLDAAAFRR